MCILWRGSALLRSQLEPTPSDSTHNDTTCTEGIPAGLLQLLGVELVPYRLLFYSYCHTLLDLQPLLSLCYPLCLTCSLCAQPCGRSFAEQASPCAFPLQWPRLELSPAHVVARQD